MPEHKRLFKQLKAGLFKWKDLDEKQKQLIEAHYPFLFSEENKC